MMEAQPTVLLYNLQEGERADVIRRCLPPAGRRAMFAFTDKVMEDFFQSFRDAKIASVGLKAAITPNQYQLDLKTALSCHEAISEEHARVMAMKKKE